MAARVTAIIAIFLCTTLAWAILGSTIMARTYSAGSGLESRVKTAGRGASQGLRRRPRCARCPGRLMELSTVIVYVEVDETIALLSLDRSRVRTTPARAATEGPSLVPTYASRFTRLRLLNTRSR